MALPTSGAERTSETFHFVDADLGKLPTGWLAARTGEGDGSVWRVVADKSAPGGNTLAQTSADGPNPSFNLCVADDTNYTDVDLEVSLKAIAGKLDQGGGLVWRYRDANNYYVARVNPLEDNFRAYHVVDGKRTQLATADCTAAADQWHTVRVVQNGKHMQCYLNGKQLVDLEDETFKDAGKIGLWSKADAQTRFVGFKVKGE
jgi:hypothetical protein